MNAGATVLFAHERMGVAKAVAHVLELHGIDLDAASSYDDAQRQLRARRYDAAILDVALPGGPSYELIAEAKELAQGSEAAAGAPWVILVASVYRKTSYKRRPVRLYGADDYVEVHHLGDMLPDKLRRLLDLPRIASDLELGKAEGRVAEALRVEGDSRLKDGDDVQALANLIVSDMVLYNGDRIAAAPDLAAARAALSEDLSVARDLLGQVRRAAGHALKDEDPIDDAFDTLMHALGRHAEASS